MTIHINHFSKERASDELQTIPETEENDRSYWIYILKKLATPILKKMSKGELIKTMPLELSPIWDGRNPKVAYMEAFARLMAGIAPYLSLPEENSEEGIYRKQLHEWALESYTNAVDPHNSDYLLWDQEGQVLVDAAYLAESFWRAPTQLWEPLEPITKERYIHHFKALRQFTPVYSNWILFPAMIEGFLLEIGAGHDRFRIDMALRKMEEWYVGDGWYSDGPKFAFDYYNSFVIQPMYMEILSLFPSLEKQHLLVLKRMQRFAEHLERFISPEGTFPVFGRSITYRMGIFQVLSLLAWQELLPNSLPEGQIRSALTCVMKRLYSIPGNFNTQGFLKLGFSGQQPHIADFYTNSGSLYMTSLSLLPLGLPANHTFWTSPYQSWTSLRAWSGESFLRDKAILY